MSREVEANGHAPPCGGWPWLDGARADLGRVRMLLLSPTPEALDLCFPLLTAAASRLGGRTMDRDWANHPPPEELRALGSEVRAVAGLLQSAADYHARWGRIVAAMCAGYTASGAPATRSGPGRLCLRG